MSFQAVKCFQNEKMFGLKKKSAPTTLLSAINLFFKNGSCFKKCLFILHGSTLHLSIVFFMFFCKCPRTGEIVFLFYMNNSEFSLLNCNYASKLNRYFVLRRELSCENRKCSVSAVNITCRRAAQKSRRRQGVRSVLGVRMSRNYWFAVCR